MGLVEDRRSAGDSRRDFDGTGSTVGNGDTAGGRGNGTGAVSVIQQSGGSSRNDCSAGTWTAGRGFESGGRLPDDQ
jgi:hypothetical protein